MTVEGSTGERENQLLECQSLLVMGFAVINKVPTASWGQDLG